MPTLSLTPKLIAHWPKLAWVAVSRRADHQVIVYHGPMVEIAEDWCVEAVWAGDFASGDFDQTDLVFGTGVRRRGDDLVFVTSGTTVDRLWHTRVDGDIYVGNTLPGVLSLTQGKLQPEHTHYGKILRRIIARPNDQKNAIPADPAEINVTYFRNIRMRNNDLFEEEKPSGSFLGTFDSYKRFLFHSAQALGANAVDRRRTHAIGLLGTISSGYDSTASAVVAREAGCRELATISQSNSLWRGSDSGLAIAERLGMSCTAYDRTSEIYPHEASFWAAFGSPIDLNFSRFIYPEPLTFLFTGFRGDKVWEGNRNDSAKPFSGPGIAGLALCEFRLIQGIFHSPVPVWGQAANERKIKTITRSEEMNPWRLNNDYDRPIPRRLVEESGVDRQMFGMRKKITTDLSSYTFPWPYSSDARQSLESFLVEHDVRHPRRNMIKLYTEAAYLISISANTVTHWLGERYRYRPDFFPEARSLIFQWANAYLVKDYYGNACGTEGGLGVGTETQRLQ